MLYAKPLPKSVQDTRHLYLLEHQGLTLVPCGVQPDLAR